MGAALGIGTDGIDDRPGCDVPAHQLSPHVHQTESEPVDPVSGHCHRQLIETHRAGHRTDFLCGGLPTWSLAGGSTARFLFSAWMKIRMRRSSSASWWQGARRGGSPQGCQRELQLIRDFKSMSAVRGEGRGQQNLIALPPVNGAAHRMAEQPGLESGGLDPGMGPALGRKVGRLARSLACSMPRNRFWPRMSPTWGLAKGRAQGRLEPFAHDLRPRERPVPGQLGVSVREGATARFDGVMEAVHSIAPTG
ncbi:hypothetical protein M2324_000280 [Rhodovulum sulfidophilum]|uniref:hypothetical protein n=1 Tax=Rhodovulum sulfidophilum TaxID=35806 RepID=UPI0005A6BB67|nr:hypothetical protein [Rhodovulum sulfidophilum]ANB34313.1 hypothetical protein A6W98_09635 [Rhodovulum sulfidophilum DSM 1374]ANB38135.1 hypothetical protein A6024_09495 [Rhodovulum sulfidophilum]MCW2301901.1 hypothetical protein [Rhodovulum sulfidophilum]